MEKKYISSQDHKDWINIVDFEDGSDLLIQVYGNDFRVENCVTLDDENARDLANRILKALDKKG